MSYTENKKLIFFLLICSLIYIAVESWFITALINSLGLNEKTYRSKEHYGLVITTIGITINILIYLFKNNKCNLWWNKLIDELESFRFVPFVLSLLLLCFGSIFSSFLVPLGFIFSLYLLSFNPKLKKASIVIALSIALFIISSFFVRATFKYFPSNSSDHLAYCSITGEIANSLAEDTEFNLNKSWKKGNNFITIEGFQLEKKMISIAACSNDSFLLSIVKSSKYKKELKRIIYSKTTIEEDVQSYGEFLKSYNKLYNGYLRVYRLSGMKYSIGYDRLNKEIARKNIKGVNSRLIMKSMGLKKVNGSYSIDFSPSDHGKTKPKSKKILFEEIMKGSFGLDVKYGTSKSQLRDQLFNTPFNQMYSDFIIDLDFNRFSDFRKYISGKYEGIIKVNIAIYLSMITILWSAASVICTSLMLIDKLHSIKTVKLLINPLVIVLLFLMLIPTPKGMRYYNESLFKDISIFSTSYNILKLHYTLYPALKDFYYDMGFTPWMNTYDFYDYSKPKEEQSSRPIRTIDSDVLPRIRKDLSLSMRQLYFTTPIQKSAILSLEKLSSFNEIRAKEIIYFNRIYNYYKKKKGSEERFEYMTVLRSRFKINESEKPTEK